MSTKRKVTISWTEVVSREATIEVDESELARYQNMDAEEIDEEIVHFEAHQISEAVEDRRDQSVEVLPLKADVEAPSP